MHFCGRRGRPAAIRVLGIASALVLCTAALLAAQEFVLVEAGSFMMGSRAEQIGRDPDEARHRVTISRDFLMSRHEVTQAEYRRVVGEDPGRFRGDELPVENLSWVDAISYCNLRSELEGLEPAYAVVDGRVAWNRAANGYRLPTEAEWEYAARGGHLQDSRGRDGDNAEAPHAGTFRYSGADELDAVGWYAENSGYRTQPVGRKAPNELGLHDMTGNVSEWVFDVYGPYPSGPVTDPAGPAFGAARVERGGGWYASARFCRVANRNASPPGTRSAGLGFRVVRNAPAGAEGSVAGGP